MTARVIDRVRLELLPRQKGGSAHSQRRLLEQLAEACRLVGDPERPDGWLVLAFFPGTGRWWTELLTGPNSPARIVELISAEPAWDYLVLELSKICPALVPT